MKIRTDIEPVAPRRCILILGMHRSGTSAATKVVNLLGAGLPQDVMGATESNESGHWEPNQIVAFNEKLLNLLGSKWDDWQWFDQDTFEDIDTRRTEDELIALINAEYKEKSLFVLKDPRICRLLPFYLKIFKRMNIEPLFAVSLRNPLSVAASLEARDQLDVNDSLKFWLSHLLQVEFWSRDFDRIFFSYEDLMGDFLPVVDRMNTFIDEKNEISPSTQEEISSFLQGQLQHFKHRLTDLKKNKNVPPLIVDAYTSLLALEKKPYKKSTISDLDTIRTRFYDSALLFGSKGSFINEKLIALEYQLKEAGETEQRLRQIANEQHALRDTAEQELSIQNGRISSVLEELKANAALRDAAEVQIADTREHIKALQEELAASEAEKARIGGISHETGLLTEQYREEMARLQAQVKDSNAEIERLAAENRRIGLKYVSDVEFLNISKRNSSQQLEQQHALVLDQVKKSFGKRLATIRAEADHFKAALDKAQMQVEALRGHQTEWRSKERSLVESLRDTRVALEQAETSLSLAKVQTVESAAEVRRFEERWVQQSALVELLVKEKAELEDALTALQSEPTPHEELAAIKLQLQEAEDNTARMRAAILAEQPNWLQLQNKYRKIREAHEAAVLELSALRNERNAFEDVTRSQISNLMDIKNEDVRNSEELNVRLKQAMDRLENIENSEKNEIQAIVNSKRPYPISGAKVYPIGTRNFWRPNMDEALIDTNVVLNDPVNDGHFRLDVRFESPSSPTVDAQLILEDETNQWRPVGDPFLLVSNPQKANRIYFVSHHPFKRIALKIKSAGNGYFLDTAELHYHSAYRYYSSLTAQKLARNLSNPLRLTRHSIEGARILVTGGPKALARRLRQE